MAQRQEIIAAEQNYVERLFDHLDEDIRAARERLAAVSLRPEGTDPDTDDLIRRETEYHSLNAKLDRAALAQLGLVFGRIDIEDPDPDDPVIIGGVRLDRRYIGRMGVQDTSDRYRSLLLDWRAPMARPFYLATMLHPSGVHRRRHIRTQGRRVTEVDEEYLLGARAEDESIGDAADIAGESALIHALHAARTGFMSNIVETIQREQDAIIRDSHRGVMVVEGGPGTGKTAVALHRVAYALYTWREQLAKTGVLIIGPNRTFLDYISRVLPELGETGVVLSTIGELYPGIRPRGVDDELAREIKGSVEMVYILQQAVKSYQVVPDEPLELDIDGVTLTVTPAMVKRARTRARRSRKPHNRGLGVFADCFIDLLADAMATAIGTDPLGGENLLSAGDRAQLHDDLADHEEVQQLLEHLWPRLTPEQVLFELTTDDERLAHVAREYDDDTRAGLRRHCSLDNDYIPQDGDPAPWETEVEWTAADAALLDELSVILGMESPEETAEAEQRAWRAQIADAQDALDVLIGSANSDLDDESDAEILSAHDVLDAETLARRQHVQDRRSTAQRAQEDHTWAYGHVVVDEAQELSEMDWRMVFRRVPNRWMTVVGDTAQTSSPAGVDSWVDSLGEFVGTRVRRHELTVNYRTPKSIMDAAALLLPIIAPEQQPARSVRDVEGALCQLPLDTDITELVERLHDRDPERRIAVIATAERIAQDAQLRSLGAMTVEACKGLEFDHVIVVAPEEIASRSPRGVHDLYVALTRATQTVTVLGQEIAAIATHTAEEG